MPKNYISLCLVLLIGVGSRASGSQLLWYDVLGGPGGYASLDDRSESDFSVQSISRTGGGIVLAQVSVHLNSSVVGTSFTFDSSSPEFNQLAEYLTNGTEENYGHYYSAFGGFSSQEGFFFSTAATEYHGDLFGFQLDRIVIKPTHYEVVHYPAGTFPGRTSAWTTYLLATEVSIYGVPVPEPPSFSLVLGAGIALLCAERRKRPRRV